MHQIAGASGSEILAEDGANRIIRIGDFQHLFLGGSNLPGKRGSVAATDAPLVARLRAVATRGMIERIAGLRAAIEILPVSYAASGPGSKAVRWRSSLFPGWVLIGRLSIWLLFIQLQSLPIAAVGG